MKFAILSLLPLLATASAIGERDGDVNTNLVQGGTQNDLPEGGMGSIMNYKAASSSGDVTTQATCPANYPLYCPRYNWCCTRAAVSCCPNSCCGAGTRYCGSDGNCYGY